MGLLDDLFRQIGDFLGGSSKSNTSNETSSLNSVSNSITSTGMGKITIRMMN